MDNLEKELFELKNENYKLPDSVLNKINLAFDEIRKIDTDEKIEVKNMNLNSKKSKSHKKIIYTAATLALATGLAFTPPVKAGIKDLIFKFQNNKGIENAVQNDYVQKISNAQLSVDDFDISLENIIYEPSKIALDFELNFDESCDIPLDKLKDSFISIDIAISDENDTIIFKDGVLGPISSCSFIIDDQNITNNRIKLQMLFNSSTATLPNTSNLKINIAKMKFMNMSTSDVIYSKDTNWDFSVEILDKFNNIESSSESVEYKFENNCPNIIVNKVQSLPTGMFVDFDYLPQGHYENLVLYSTLIDGEGNEYHLTNGANMDTAAGGVGDNISGIFEGLTSFDNPSSFTLRIQNPNGVTFDEVLITK